MTVFYEENNGRFPDIPIGVKIPKSLVDISDTLLELLRKKPLEKISVKEICTLAQINRTTFYNHYTDKYELFEKSITYMMQVLDDEIGRLPDESGYNASLNIFRLVRQYHFLFEHILIADGNSEARFILMEVFVRSLRKYTGWMTERYEGAEQKLVANHYYAGAFLAVIEWWLRERMQTDEHTMAEYLSRVGPNQPD